METYKRTCKTTVTFQDGDMKITLKKGQTYRTSRSIKGKVHIFSNYWFWAPTSLFGKPRRETT